ncbi:LysR family transcriptional regulator [Acuticoccus mangrovi]|uniref:LysR family transcriptional regulator n=1 Tax=Acuticoccus mangrovi TaxID=2796142 RepID=A0A934IM45_9HYPH|nr:LysR family transcriptional regulator [Acuticoccus mangrovi]MBJ3774435.1 LysR family transcriptional regulator [Acuticoccus mangrovi]
MVERLRHLLTLRLVQEIARTGSVRKAGELMSITPSAVQRRLQLLEEELGQPIFERLPNGMRLNPAGEVVLQHIRQQFAEVERLRGSLAELSGMRRGHVSIACSQAVVSSFLPSEIVAYQALYPDVTFNVEVLDHLAASARLADFTADMALVYDVSNPPDVDVVVTVPQRIYAVMGAGHPLAHRKTLRLDECLAHPLALPNPRFGGRVLLNRALAASGRQIMPKIECNSFEFLKAMVASNNYLTFQIPIGAPVIAGSPIVTVPVDSRDIDAGNIYFRQLRGRTLPIAAQRFADQITRSLSTYEPVLAPGA